MFTYINTLAIIAALFTSQSRALQKKLKQNKVGSYLIRYRGFIICLTTSVGILLSYRIEIVAELLFILQLYGVGLILKDVFVSK